MSLAHSFGISIPASRAARITDVPSGTDTCLPSTVSEMVLSDFTAGVP